MKPAILFLLFFFFKIYLFSEDIIEVSLDGEFKNLESARDYIRKLRKTYPQKSYIIEIREGIYKLDEGIVFGRMFTLGHESDNQVATTPIMIKIEAV